MKTEGEEFSLEHVTIEGEELTVEHFTKDVYYREIIAKKVFDGILHSNNPEGAQKDVNEDLNFMLVLGKGAKENLTMQLNVVEIIKAEISQAKNDEKKIKKLEEELQKEESKPEEEKIKMIGEQARIIATSKIAQEWQADLNKTTSPEEYLEKSKAILLRTRTACHNAYKSDTMDPKYDLILAAIKKAGKNRSSLSLVEKCLIQSIDTGITINGDITEKKLLEAYAYLENNELELYKESYNSVRNKCSEQPLLKQYIIKNLKLTSETCKAFIQNLENDREIAKNDLIQEHNEFIKKRKAMHNIGTKIIEISTCALLIIPPIMVLLSSLPIISIPVVIHSVVIGCVVGVAFTGLYLGHSITQSSSVEEIDQISQIVHTRASSLDDSSSPAAIGTKPDQGGADPSSRTPSPGN